MRGCARSLLQKIKGLKDQTNIKEAILPVDEILPERQNDWKEVNKDDKVYKPLAIKALKKTSDLDKL